MSWICPHCGTTATLQPVDVDRGSGSIAIDTAKENEGISVEWKAVKCPASSCGQFVLDISTWFGAFEKYSDIRQRRTGTVLANRNMPFGAGSFRFEPRVGLPLSQFAPKAVVNDYNEACLIKDLSPKASATLCRRALQGMVRDYWQVQKPTLWAELEEIKPHCDTALFDAMTGLRSVGNIGAHPERDINLIIDVEEGEVDSLLGLLHILDKEWYVAKASRASRLAAVVALGASKAAMKSPTTSPQQVEP